MIADVVVTRITCDRPSAEGERPCESFLSAATVLDAEAAAVAAVEHGWSTGPDGQRCPKHRAP